MQAGGEAGQCRSLGSRERVSVSMATASGCRRRRRRAGHAMRAAAEAARRATTHSDQLGGLVQDLRSWERAHESDLPASSASDPAAAAQEYPPIRSKSKKAKPPAKMEQRISSIDYSAWDKYDANTACKNIDGNKASKSSMDSRMSEEDKKIRLITESQLEKEKGNDMVKLKRWDEAISFYTNAINIYKKDATYYANRGLCYLKKDNLHAAEADCTAALDINPGYIKALLRRSTAREGLGSLRRAAEDLSTLLLLEPTNVNVSRHLASLIARMGTKGKNCKSSPNSPGEDGPSHPLLKDDGLESPEAEKQDVQEKKEKGEKSGFRMSMNPEKLKTLNEENPYVNKPNGRPGSERLYPINKPIHMRSKKPMVRIPVQEHNSKNCEFKQRADALTHMILQQMHGETMYSASAVQRAMEIETGSTFTNIGIELLRERLAKLQEKIGATDSSSSETEPDSPKKSKAKKNYTKNDCVAKDYGKKDDSSSDEEEVPVVSDKPGVPKSSVQFMADWRLMKGRHKDRSAYLSAIPPSQIPSIFKNSLEFDILSEIIYTLYHGIDFKKDKGYTRCLPYLSALTKVKRFSALTMFMSQADKDLVTRTLERCYERERGSRDEVKNILIKYEII